MKKRFIGALALVAVTATNSMAALSTDQQALADSITGMITDWTTWGWTAVLAVLGFTIGAKIVKKFVGKAT